jgi:CxxC motif-containing protein (DUF1111 family)
VKKRHKAHGDGVSARCRSISITLFVATLALVAAQVTTSSQTSSGFKAADPGVRAGAAGAGGAIAGLTARQAAAFAIGSEEFAEADDVPEGLGPRMNLDSCVGCHSQPAAGGSSPAVNPQIAFAMQGSDQIPSFLSLNGPAREARFVRNSDGTPDGGVHALFTINRRDGANGCKIAQPDFEAQVASRNVIFRIPTPVFGAGLMEQIPDEDILSGQSSNGSLKAALGIRGRANFSVAGRTITGQSNNNGNDGTVGRFGWKAQNKSLLLFSGEAYNVEMGVTNELFQTERDEAKNCQYANTPNSITDVDADGMESLSSIEKFSHFMRFLAAPATSTTPGGSVSIGKGRNLFANVGCVFCHTPSFQTGNSTIAALRYQPVNLFSDLLVHDMGTGLADGVSQGQAGPREFRSAPLWGLGQRIFFLHDGRTSDLLAAIAAHSSEGSEANGVYSNFLGLTETDKQDLLNFLRSL